MQTSEYSALISQDGDWWVGWVEEIPGVDCQESSREELVETLQITLREAIAMSRKMFPTTPASA
jgi:predicted RNase H-like HicB family nuclease